MLLDKGLEFLQKAVKVLNPIDVSLVTKKNVRND
jgi:hypothetical protein